MDPNLTIECEVQKDIKFDSIGESWCLIKIPPIKESASLKKIHIVLLFDIGSCINPEEVKSMMSDIISIININETHCLDIILFNESVQNINDVLEINNITFSGSIDLTFALSQSFNFVNSTPDCQPIIMLFMHNSLSQNLTELSNKPDNCIIHTFNMGTRNNMSQLYDISAKNNGTYHTINKNTITSIVGSVFNDIINIHDMTMQIRLTCNKGTRIISIWTNKNITEHLIAKD